MRRRVLVTAFGSVFVTYFCFQQLTPLYPRVARDLGLDAGSLGLLVGVSSIVIVVLQIPAGVSSDRRGRRPFIAAGMLALIGAQVLRWWAPNPAAFALAQAVAGICLGVATLGAFAAVADVYRISGRAQAIGILNSAITLGQVGGYLLAGSVGVAIGWRAMSLLVALLPLLTLGLVLTMPEPSRPASTTGVGREMAAALRYLVRPRVAAFGAMAALVLAVGQGAAYLLPFALQARGLGPLTTSLLLVPYIAGSVVAAPLAGRWADRLGTRLLMLVALAVGTAATALFPLVHTSIPLVVLCYLLIGGSVNAVLSLVAARVVTVAAGAAVGAGTALGSLRVGQSLGPAIGAALAGVAFTRGGVTSAYLALAAALVLGGLLYPDAFRAEEGGGG